MGEPTGYGEHADPADAPAGPRDLVDGTPGEDPADGGETDTEHTDTEHTDTEHTDTEHTDTEQSDAALTTDDDAQHEEGLARPGNAVS